MDAANPYAPPLASLGDARAVEPEPDLPPWRLEGAALLVRHGATLPDICLFTGEPTTPAQRLRFPLSWTPAWFRIAIVLGTWMTAMAYSALRRTSNVEMGLGPAGRKRHRLHLLLTTAASVDAMVMVVVGITGGAALLGFLFLVFLGLFFAAVFSRAFRVVRIDRHYAHLMLRSRVTQVFARLPPPR
jgi:hypothetical protein